MADWIKSKPWEGTNACFTKKEVETIASFCATGMHGLSDTWAEAAERELLIILHMKYIQDIKLNGDKWERKHSLGWIGKLLKKKSSSMLKLIHNACLETFNCRYYSYDLIACIWTKDDPLCSKKQGKLSMVPLGCSDTAAQTFLFLYCMKGKFLRQSSKKPREMHPTFFTFQISQTIRTSEPNMCSL